MGNKQVVATDSRSCPATYPGTDHDEQVIAFYAPFCPYLDLSYSLNSN
jgi:hypothetical protein